MRQAGIKRQSNTRCAECQVGKYTDGDGKAACYTASQKMSRCKTRLVAGTARQAGPWSTQEECNRGRGEAAPNSMKACKTSQRLVSGQSSGSLVLRSCDRGMYSKNAFSPCTTCAIGSRQPYRGRGECEFCGPGKYSANSISYQCTGCPEGTWHNDSRATAYGHQNVCKMCPAGKAVSSPEQAALNALTAKKDIPFG